MSNKKALISFCILMALGTICLSLEVEIVSENTMRKIFDENQLMVIYVCEERDPETYETFSDYCWEHPCAYLDVTFYQTKKSNQLYETLRNFVGHPASNYFLILDAPRQHKYVLEIKDVAKYKDIYNFEADFTSQKIQPYFSSQEEPTQMYEPCRKLVGKNFDRFMGLKAPIKVVFLYTEQEGVCQICGEMLRGFADIAEKLYRQDVIAFGYFDIFKNDHPLITSEILPYFLVFRQGESEPYGIEGQKFPQLQKALINIIAQHIYPDYKKNQQQQDGQQIRIQLEDIEQIDGIKFQENQQAENRNFQL